MQKTAALLTDISGLGKCAATIALPVLATLGISASIAPTCILSSHTGGLGTPVKIDMTEHLPRYTEQWKAVGARFDAISTGYLASAFQLDAVVGFLDNFADDALVLVDPVMADHGRLYSGFDASITDAMRTLCSKANVIVPNRTEACLLAGCEYRTGICSDDDIDRLFDRLTVGHNADVVITGIHRSDTTIACAVKNRNGDITVFERPIVNGRFHGSGDLFSSVVLGCLMNDRTIEDAAHFAGSFVGLCAQYTLEQNTDPRFGLCFEPMLPRLYGMIYS